MFLRPLTRFRSFSCKHDCISKGALESSSNKNLRDTSSRHPHRNDRTILTLDPNKFAEMEQQRLPIGKQQSFSPNISLLKRSRLVCVPRLSCGEYRHIGKRIRLAYPPGMKAFLYYSISPEKPRIAGELRFRVASSDDPASFKSGSDFLRRDGVPWSRPLYSLQKYYLPLYEKLREEGLVSDDLDKVLSTLTSPVPKYCRSHYLYTLNDTFIIDFSSHKLIFLVITEQGVESLPFVKLFYDCRIMYETTPYKGSALVRFEHSTLPEHKGTRTVVLRFLKIIAPVERVFTHYDNYICRPKEGELHWKVFKHNSYVNQVWSVNIDIPLTGPGNLDHIIMQRCLQLLWDA